jgi:hypothetical protein
LIRNDDQTPVPSEWAVHNSRESQARSQALVQAIRRQIVNRTGGRIQSLKVELMGAEVVIRGIAPCYYVKQLALQGILDVLGSAQEIEVELNLQVAVCPTGSEYGNR